MNLQNLRIIFIRYMVPILTVLAITFLMVTFKGVFNRVPFVFYFSAVLVSGWYGTLQSSLLATLISGFTANYFFFNSSKLIPDIETLIPTFIFFVEGAAFGFIIQAHKKANRKANDALALRDEFISIASHELKNPLTILSTYGQLISRWQKEKENKKVKHGIAIMNKEITRFYNLIQQLLDISRIRQGKMELEKERFNLTFLLKETIEQIQHTTKTHKIIFRQKVKKIVYADKHRIKQVVVNLLINAISYSPKSKKVLVKLTGDKKKAVISIRDYGVGIAKEHQEKIFDRYYRINKETSGMGLGLYVASQIIKEHGEKLKVKSRIGRGSQFFFSLPLVPAKKSKI